MHDSLAVVPVLVGPMQVLLAILPGILMALGGTLVYLLKPSTMKVGLQLLWRVKVTVVLVTAVVAGSVTLAGAVLPQRQTSVSEAEASAHDWPQFRGGLARRGALPGAAGPVQGGINWTFNQPADTFYSSPTVVGNRVYVASATGLSVFNKQGVGEIFCLDADTGGLVWRGGPSDYRATFSSPSVVGNRLAIGEGLHQARDARVVVLDLDRDGEVLWTYRTNSHAESSPVIHDGRVYSGSGRDGWYCFELEPDADGNAQVVWHVPGDRYPDASGSASVHDGVVYVPMGRWGGTGVAALDADTGDELWRIDTAHAVFSGPTIAEQANLLFVGMGTGNFIQTAEQAITAELNYLREQGATEAEVEAARPRFGPGGAVWAIDLDTHDVQWRFDTERAVLGQVAAADDRIYFGSRDGHLYSVSFAGDLLGKWNAHAPIVASPAVTDDHVYIVTENGRLYGLTRDTLRPVWEFTLADTGRFLSSPAVARGQVYVGTEGAGLLAVGSPASDDRDADTPHWPGHLAGPGQPGSLAAGPLPGRGGLLWRYPDPDDDNETPAPHISAPPAYLDQHLYLPIADGSEPGIVSLPLDDASRDAPTPRWFHPVANGVHRSPAVTADLAFFTDGQPGDADRHLHALDLDTGDVQWQHPLATGVAGRFVIDRDRLYIQDQDEHLTQLDHAGDVQWRQRLGRVVHTPASHNDMLVVATDRPAMLAALDRHTGRTLWRVPLADVPTTGPAVVDHTIYLGTEQGLAAHDLRDGSQRWGVGGGAVTSTFTMGRHYLAYINPEGTLHLIDHATGDVIATQMHAQPDVPPLFVRDRLVYLSRGNLLTLDLDQPDTARPQRWMAVGWLGEITAPLVAVDASLYLATDERGLVRIGRPQ